MKELFRRIKNEIKTYLEFGEEGYNKQLLEKEYKLANLKRQHIQALNELKQQIDITLSEIKK